MTNRQTEKRIYLDKKSLFSKIIAKNAPFQLHLFCHLTATVVLF